MRVKRYSRKQKLTAVRRVVAGGEDAAALAGELGVTLETLGAWVRHLAPAPTGAPPRRNDARRRGRSERLLRLAARAARVGGWGLTLPELRLFCSDETRALLDITPGAAPIWPQVLVLCDDDSRRRLEAAVAACAHESTPFDLILALRTPAERALSVRMLGQAVHGLGRRPVRIEGAVQDVTEQRAVADDAAHHMARLELAEAHAGLGSWELDSATGEVWWSRQMYVLMGCDPDAPPPGIDAFLTHVHPQDRPLVAHMFDAIVRGERPSAGTFRTDPAHGAERLLRPTIHVHADATASTRYFGTLLDVTERELADAALRRSERLLRIAGEAARIGGWTYDLAQDRAVWSDEVCAIHEVPLGTSPRAAQAFGFYAPESREVLLRAHRACVEQAKPIDEELQIVTPQGRRVWVRVIGQPVVDERGRTVQLQGALQDITEKKEAEQALRRLAERLANTLESITDAFYTLDRDWRFTYLNGEAERLLQRDSEALLGRSVWEEFPQVLDTELEREYRRAVRDRVTIAFEAWFPFLARWLELRAYPSEEGLAVYFQDITERRRAQDALRASEERFETVAKSTTDAIWDWDLVADRLWWSDGMRTLFGYEPVEVGPGVDGWLSKVHPDDSHRVMAEIDRAIAGDASEWQAEYRFRRKNGGYAEVLDHGTLMRDAAGRAARMVGGISDITERKRAAEEIQRLAFYDPLTGLPNRRLLLERLRHALELSARNGQLGGLLVIDLDNFKTLNDTLGHQKGDQLLQAVAERLPACVRESDTVSRFGGDEFVVMVEGLGPDPDEAGLQLQAVGEKVLAALEQSYGVGGHEHHSTASVGVTLFRGHEHTGDQLLQRADVALYQAKAAGRNTLRFFDPGMQAAVSARARLEAELREALARGEFRLHYQPQADAHGRLLGAEALLRWQHPRRGLVGPGEFVPLAEETGLILPLGEWVLETACAQAVAWAARPETARLRLAVNISARQFHHADFVPRVQGVLKRTGADPRCIKLELTESLLVQDMEDTVTKMSALRECGVGFSLDDFGTGYSSLYYLKRLPLDELKIDHCFVRDVLDDPNDAAIVRAVIALAQSLGLTAVAEGVESRPQQEFLARHGCRVYQGDHLCRPLSAEDFQRYAGNGRRASVH